MSLKLGTHMTAAQRGRLDAALLSGLNAPEAAFKVGIGRSTATRRLTALRREGKIEPTIARQDTIEYADAKFWRAKLAEETKRANDATRAAAEVAGVMARPVKPPRWTLPKPGVKRHSSLGLLQVSDLHVGEVVEAAAVGDYNRYDVATFVKRFRRMVAAAVPITKRWAADTKLEGFVMACNGDLISGDIHDELRITNELTAQEQVNVAADEIIAGAHVLAGAFGKLLITFTPGNHGRTTLKPPSKKISALSYDILIGSIVAREFRDDKRVTVQLSNGADLIYDLLGWTVFQSHGDHLGTGGGKGFGGPELPIVRGNRMAMLNAFAQGKHYDISLSAHYHKSSNPGTNLANGSMVGYSEYGQHLRALPEPPMQWLALVHERWGLRERIPLVLDEVPRPGRH